MPDRKIYQLNIFGEREAVTSVRGKGSRAEILEDYEGFVNKFKPKKTTDDCYTPPEVYDTVRDWVDANICPLAGRRIVRPFYPGGDYQNEEYRLGDIVLDNPPFSILAKIIDFYTANHIDFFLFAPHLALFTAPRDNVTYIVAYGEIIYENGAIVKTSFVTNLEKKHRILVAGSLCTAIKECCKKKEKEKKKNNLRKLSYPDHLVTPALLGKIAKQGVDLRIPMKECAYIGKFDNMGIRIFGGGYLISERMMTEKMAAERLAAEKKNKKAAERLESDITKTIQVNLSEREMEIIRNLSKTDIL